MALFKEDIQVAPSVDIATLTQLDSTSIESGIYYCTQQKTITAGAITIQSSKWSVICISSESRTSIHCYAQLWIPSETTTNPTAFIRYSASGNTWSDFSALLSNKLGVQNSSADDIRLVVSNTQPSAISGVTQVWIDTSS